MSKKIRILIVDDEINKSNLVQEFLRRLSYLVNKNLELEFIVLESVNEYREKGSPTDFDLAFIDQYLGVYKLSKIQQVAMERGIKLGFEGAWIVNTLKEANPKLYDSTFSISLEGVPNIKSENQLRNYSDFPVFKEKVLPILRKLAHEGEDLNENSSMR